MLKNRLITSKLILWRSLREQKGQSIIIFAFVIIGLIAMMGLAIDLGLVYIEKVRVNRTTDAATLAAVVELPYEQDAIERAIEYIQLNGYNVNPVNGDTQILIRGCVDKDRSFPFTGAQNWTEVNTNPISPTTTITGSVYIASAVQPPQATFVIDTGSYQSNNGDSDDDEECNPTTNLYGTANKIRVVGEANVRMNFMQFFGFGTVPVQDEAVAENVTNLDVMVVFDTSGSMEFETTCYDCWTRTKYDVNTSPFPNNGYFNPLPYNPAYTKPGKPQSIPASTMCSVYPPVPWSQANGGTTYSYLVHEAELYSRNVSDYRFQTRLPGQGFWVIQRASRKSSNAILEVDGVNTNNEATDQGNQAGSIANQSSNVCNPAAGGIDCTVASGNSNICNTVDCSAFIAAHPYASYGQTWDAAPSIQGGTYDLDCFTTTGGLSGHCWADREATYGKANNNVPWVEYDFTPTWSGSTYIWIRAIGSGDRAYEWYGPQPNLSGAMTMSDKAIYWQVDTSAVTENKDVNPASVDYRDNRSVDSDWRWIKLTPSPGLSFAANTQHVLKLYEGSPGYKVDKIIFTNDSGGSSGSPPPAMRRNLAGSTVSSDGGDALGPQASQGSATREACNKCNPAFGYQVNPADCTCRLNATQTGYGTGKGCTGVSISNTVQLNDDLYTGVQPIRGAQEAVKRFIMRLDPKFDQVGFIAFESNVINDANSRSKLQCLAQESKKGDVKKCYDPTTGTPISYTNVLVSVERQWPRWGTNIGEGMKEALEELGVSGYATDNTCTTTANDGHSCGRGGAARRVIILVTDGSPNANPGSCAPGSGRPDLWNGLIGASDDSYECSMYYAWEAANNNVTLYVIGLGAGVNIDLLNAMATGVDLRGEVPNDGNDVTYFNSRGGQFFNAATPEELDSIFDTILTSIYVRIVG